MTPAYADEWLTVYAGDCRAVLRELPDESVHCVVTSPPYWGLRDYGVEGQIGLEAKPEDYIATLVEVFREVRRVLRADGTVWLNLGDVYATSGGDNPAGSSDGAVGRGDRPAQRRRAGLKPKDLLGIPWRVAFALQADGWWLRSDVVWSKPNGMPEGPVDRPSRSHEFVFMLTKRATYFYDLVAVREPFADARMGRDGGHKGRRRLDHRLTVNHGSPDGIDPSANGGRNLRDVWSIPTEPYPEAHFATFPQRLVEPCLRASTSERGVCPQCGAPWQRLVEKDREPRGDAFGRKDIGEYDHGQAGAPYMEIVSLRTVGWEPTCEHDEIAVPPVVLDPFGGSGTVALVAERLRRRAILVELNTEYVGQALERIAQGRRDGSGAAIDMDLPAPAGSLWEGLG